MRSNRRKFSILLTATTLLTIAVPSDAMDTIRVTSGAIGDWDVSALEYGKRVGIFSAKRVEPQISYSDGSAATLQALISGSSDIGVGVGVSGFLAAALRGAPVKIVSSQYKGAFDQLWYVRSDNRIRSFKDVTEQSKVCFTTNGSSSHIVLLALVQQYDLKNTTLIPCGNEAAMLTQVMSGQIDVGWNSDGGISFGDVRDKVRTIGTGAELPHFHDLSVRTIISNTDNLTKRRDAIGRFLHAYQETLDWMYGPGEQQALQWHAQQKRVSVEEARRVRDAIYPREGLRLGPLSGVELSIKQAVDAKRIPAAISLEQFNLHVDIVWQPPQ